MPNPYVNKVVQSNGTTLIDISDTTAVAADVASGKYFYLASGEKVEGTASGGGTLVQKSITLNGTYDPDDDNADGYSEVTVNVQGGASMTEVANTYGTELVITSAQSAAPSATRHTLYFEFEDETTETEYAYYDDSFISGAITATTPTTRNNKTVTLAQLDGTTWYSYAPPSPSDIPLNTQLIDYNAVTNGVAMYDDGRIEETEYMCLSDYTAIDPSMTFTIVGNPWFGTGFYDSSKTLISAAITNDLGGVLNSSNIPAGAAWVRISAIQGADDSELSLIRTA